MDTANLLETGIVKSVSVKEVTSKKNNNQYKFLEIEFDVLDTTFTISALLESAQAALITLGAKQHYADNDVNLKSE